MTTISANTTITQAILDGYASTVTMSGGTVSSPVVVKFLEDISINRNIRFLFGSNYITVDGSKNTIRVNVNGFSGLFDNGYVGSPLRMGRSFITIRNINIVAGSSSTLSETLAQGSLFSAGYLCRASFATGATNNIVENCSCVATTVTNQLANYEGFLFGAYLASPGNIIVSNCYVVGNAKTTNSNSGLMFGSNACGVGPATTNVSRSIIVKNCYSVGTGGGGGIFGNVGSSSGGTVGTITVTDCYNLNGTYTTGNGAIIGRRTSGTLSITNCFASGTSYLVGNSSDVNITKTSCYAADNAWDDTTASSNLIINTGVWVDISLSATNVPWRLASSTPLYTPSLIKSRSLPITTSAGLLSSISRPYTYSVIAVNNSPTLPSGFSINTSTGVITCTSASSFNYNVQVMAYLNANYGYSIGNIQIIGSPLSTPVVSCMCPDFGNNRIFVATYGNTAGSTNTTINGLGILNLTNNTWSSLNLNTNLAGNVYTMSLYNDKLFVGGSFYNVNNNNNLNYAFKYNVSANTIVPISSATLGNAVSTNNSTQRHGPSSSIITTDGTLYCHGKFGTTGAVVSSGASLFPYYDFNTQTLNKQYASVTTTGDGIATFCQVNSTDLYVGGNFTNIGGASVSYFAKGDTTTKTFSSVGTFDNYVSLSVFNPTNNTIYLFGAFSTINGVSFPYMAGYDVSTPTPTFTNVGGFKSPGTVNDVSIDIPNQRLYIVGSFTTFTYADETELTLNTPGLAIHNIQVDTWVSPPGGFPTYPTPSPTSILKCAMYSNAPNYGVFMITDTNRLYQFSVSGTNWIKRFSGTNVLATSTLGSPSYNSMVYCSYDKSLYIGGVFDTCTAVGSSIACNNILRFDLSNSTPTSHVFSALDLSGSVNGFTNGVQCMYFNPADNYLYVGGGFNWVAGQKITNYARYNVVSRTWSSIWPSTYSLVPADEQTVASGTYVSGAGKVRPGYRMHIYNNGTSNQTMYMSTYTFDVNSTNNLNTFAKLTL
jgi:hypothetical protein